MHFATFSIDGEHNVAARNVKHYLLIIVCGLVILAAVILVLMNIGNYTERMSVYWRGIGRVSVGLLMLLSAAAGIIVFFLAKVFLRSSLGLWKSRRQEKRMAEVARKGMEQASKQE
jgi:uncharacterized integral membrane protein